MNACAKLDLIPPSLPPLSLTEKETLIEKLDSKKNQFQLMLDIK